MAIKDRTLIQKIDLFAISLMEDAAKDIVLPDGPLGEKLTNPASIPDRVKVFESVLKYVQIKNKLDDDEEPDGGIAALARQLREGDTVKRPRSRAKGAQNGAGTEPDDTPSDYV